MSDIARGSLSAELVAEYTDALTRHYGEPVRPVSQYCQAFADWRRAIGEKVKRIRAGEERCPWGDEGWEEICGAYDRVTTAIPKSNLLARLIYGGERLRSKPCPEHHGRWSGCVFSADEITCGCGASANITGWLAENDDDRRRYVGGPIGMIIEEPAEPRASRLRTKTDSGS
jgi:hypothetical protein